MNATATLIPDLSALADDGDRLVLPNGQTLVLRIEPDECGSVFDDGDWHGDLQWGTRDRDTGRNVRPDGFDGSAEVIVRDRSDALWWAPPADATRDADLKERLRSAIVALWHQGYSVVTLELHEAVTDSTGART